ncbi:sigma 54-interacting transcriptional regulator [Pseudomonas aeruginosa]
MAPRRASVLVIGETGTGKELVARHIHSLSARRTGPFVAVSCGGLLRVTGGSRAVPATRGAFTGALAAKAGWFEEGNGGTLFLDEIGDLPMPIQVRLLRVLQEREGGAPGVAESHPHRRARAGGDQRATGRAINAGHFREDLLPAQCRQSRTVAVARATRRHPALTRHFIAEYSRRLGCGRAS